MDRPSPNLSWNELKCQDGTEYPHMFRTDTTRLINLVESFEALRAKLGPLVVLSAYRSREYNKKIAGAQRSQHVEGRALDIKTPKGMKPRELFDTLVNLANVTPIRGIGLYRWGCHFDVRPQTNLSLWKDNGSGEI
jgi:uncharacterized protein YcbK (DUF882 family)